MAPCVFEYTDYRKYLNDYFAYGKEKTKAFSYKFLSIKAGFKNKGFIYNVMHGSKNLSKESAVKLSRALSLNKAEADYFENLVFFNQAPDLKERNYYYEKMSNIKPRRNMNKVLEIQKEQYNYYSDWRNSAIRSLIELYPFKGDFNWLAKNIYPAITPKDAKKSVDLLLKLGFVNIDESGTYKLTERHITTGNEVGSLAVQNLHKDMSNLAVEALSKLDKSKRNLTGLTVGISERCYARICESINEFRSQIIKMVDEDKEADRVYQVNFQVFPLSSTDIKTQNLIKEEV